MGLRARPRVGRRVRQPSAAGWGRGHVVIVHTHAAPWRPVSMKQNSRTARDGRLGSVAVSGEQMHGQIACRSCGVCPGGDMRARG